MNIFHLNVEFKLENEVCSQYELFFPISFSTLKTMVSILLAPEPAPFCKFMVSGRNLFLGTENSFQKTQNTS